jgi:Holliday junction resolvase
MIFEIIQIIGPSILIMIGFYLYIDKKANKKIAEFQKERELLEKLKKEKEEDDNFTIEFEEEIENVEKYVKQNEEKYKPKKEKPHYLTERINTSKLNKNENTKEDIIDAEIIKENEKSYYEKKKEFEKIGRKYELKVKKFFENLGYEVIDNAGIKGKKDEGIDLIAVNKSKDEYLCIQCKYWKKRKINYNHIKQFLSDYILYLKKHKKEVILYKNRKFILAIPDKILTKAAYARIKENKDIIDYKIIN